MEWPSDLSLYPRYLHPRIKKGFGLGVGEYYLPWLRVRDVRSEGTSANIFGIKLRRRLHLLSGLESTYYGLVERESDVIDIREQFPILDLKSTLRLCAEHQIRHTQVGRFPEPFTIDFLITRRTSAGLRYEARSIKTPEDAKNPAIQARLRIEYEWCLANGIPWALVSTEDFTKELASSLVFVRAWFKHRYEPNLEQAMQFSEQFLSVYEPNRALKSLIVRAAKRLGQGEDLAQDVFRYCAWSSLIEVELRRKVLLNLPLVLMTPHG